MTLPMILALALQATPEPERFVPALHFESRTPEQWCAELDRTEGRSTDAVWSLYYHDDRSSKVLRKLHQWKRGDDTQARRAIDTVLVDWGEGMLEKESFYHSWGDRTVHGEVLWDISARAVIPYPALLDETATDESLLEQIAEGDAQEAATAAVNLVVRGERAVEALVALSRRPEIEDEAPRVHVSDPVGPPTVPGVWEWAEDYAPTAVEEAQRAAATGESPSVGDELFESARVPGAAGDEALIQLARRAGLYYTTEANYHGTVIKSPVQVSEFERFGLALTDRLAGGDRTEHVMRYAHRLAMESPEFAERMTPLFREVALSGGEGSLEALRVLCHLGPVDAPLRERYVEVLTRWPEPESAEAPCLTNHDEETIRALLGRLHAAKSPARLSYQVGMCGLGDDATVAAALVEDWQSAGTPLFGLVRAGVRSFAPRKEDETEEEAMGRAIMNAATLRDRGEPYEAPLREIEDLLLAPYERHGAGGDYVTSGLGSIYRLGLFSPRLFEACMDILEREMFSGGYHYHKSGARRLLASHPLTAEQRRRWEAVDPDGFPEGEPALASIETIPWTRYWAYRGRIENFADVCRITRVCERDLTLMAEFLPRAKAEYRSLLLELVREHDLDSKLLRAAVVDRFQDPEPGVRHAARVLAAERGWSTASAR